MMMTMNKLMILIVLALLPAFIAAPAAMGQSNEECLDCHDDDEFTGFDRKGTEISVYVDPAIYLKSVHGREELECIDCHADIDEIPHADDLEPVDCGSCHDDAQAAFNLSAHFKALERSGRSVTCASCHGKHDIMRLDDEGSPVAPARVKGLCASCHDLPEVIRLFGRGDRSPIAAYEESVHGRAFAKDPAGGAPNCVSCHGSHAIRRKMDLRSSTADPNLPETCGACHEAAKAEYLESDHWRALSRGHFESPVCNDCHGAHRILGKDEKADGDPMTLSWHSRVCQGCHMSEVLMARFGLDAERFDSYMKTYHALAVLAGSKNAAECVSCHETHRIKSQHDPESSVHADNLTATCGRCHEGATTEFARIPIHPVDLENRNGYAWWTAEIYVYLIVAVVGGMLLHNLVILFYYIRGKYRGEKKAPAFQRFKRFEVLQHFLLLVSFFLLAVTGFALKYPGAFWVDWLTGIGMTEEVRASLHRTGAVVMVFISVIQVFYLLGTRAGRRDVAALRPGVEDLRHFFENMRFHLRLSKKYPRYGRFDYMEKVEYLALIWGVFVMAATGFILWFPEIFAKWLPWWAFEVAEAVHFFEAILATLAILFWHWFFVIYHPEVYPLKLTMLHGKIPEADLEHHHPKEYEELKK